MKRVRWIAALTMTMGVVLIGRAEAQAPGGLQVGFDLLLNPVVQKDLKLDEHQVTRSKELLQDLHDRQRALIAKLEGLDRDERIKKSNELTTELVEYGTKELVELLNPDQQVRFRQIDLQHRGASAMADPATARLLELTAGQSDELKRILDQSIIRRREAQSNTRGDRRATTAKIQVIRTETDAQAIALLTPKQAEVWKSMIGKPIDFNREAK